MSRADNDANDAALLRALLAIVVENPGKRIWLVYHDDETACAGCGNGARHDTTIRGAVEQMVHREFAARR